MKKRLLIILGVIIVLVLGVVIWNHTHTDRNNLGNIHSLESVSVYLQQKGADYTVDRLDYLTVYGYTRDDLVEVWGTPNERIPEINADAWILSDENKLIVCYNADGEIAEIEVQSIHN